MGVKYLVTGAAGNLGANVVDVLTRTDCDVRALVRKRTDELPASVEQYIGDVTDEISLRGFFELPEGTEIIVIHCAGIVTIYPRFSQKVYDVNVGGTKRVVDICCEKLVRKLVYVSSVHSIPEQPRGTTMAEITDFDPDLIKGFYGKTKAEASRIVMDAVRERGLNASIVFPSGLLGPGDARVGHMTRLILDASSGKLPAGIDGGYDFSDVRDVAEGVVAASQRGGAGENYILGNRYVSVREILASVHEITGAKLVKTMLPAALVTVLVPAFAAYYKAKKRPPLFTAYSLYTLRSNSIFSSEKAKRELGYTTRPFSRTVADTIDWLRRTGRLK